MRRLPGVLILLLSVLFTGIPSFAQAPLPEEAGACLLIEMETGEILFEKNPQGTLFPASTTKIMTAILAIEKGSPDQKMTASKSAIGDIGPNDSNIGIRVGETMLLDNLLQALLISSANEAANIIAENISESRAEFIELMNDKAKKLGALNTHFVNAHGLHDPMQFTTASDIAKIALYAMSIPKFREIVASHTYQLPSTNKTSEWPVLSSTNKLMLADKNDLYVINGIKTGFTGPAGYNLISSATDTTGMELISVVMNVRNEKAAENVRIYSKELLDYGFGNFKKVLLLEEGKVYRNVRVEDSIDPFGLDLLISGSLICVLPKVDTYKNVKEIPHINDNITAPVNKGDILGYVEFFRDNISVGKVNLTASRDILPQIVNESVFSRIKEFLQNQYVKIALSISGFLLFLILLKGALGHILKATRLRKQ